MSWASIQPRKKLAEANIDWTVPKTEGAYPNFAVNATKGDEKKEIFQFIKQEKGIKVVEATEELLNGDVH